MRYRPLPSLCDGDGLSASGSGVPLLLVVANFGVSVLLPLANVGSLLFILYSNPTLSPFSLLVNSASSIAGSDRSLAASLNDCLPLGTDTNLSRRLRVRKEVLFDSPPSESYLDSSFSLSSLSMRSRTFARGSLLRIPLGSEMISFGSSNSSSSCSD